MNTGPTRALLLMATIATPTDSRASAVGYVPFENFVGKAQIIFFDR